MEEHQIRTLLDLHDQIIDQEDGYWLKIEAWEVTPSKDIPHGISTRLRCTHPVAKGCWGMTTRMPSK